MVLMMMKKQNKRQKLCGDDDDVVIDDGTRRSDQLVQDDPRPWAYLPDDLLHSIFSLLKNQSSHLVRVSMVCKQWQAASVCDDLWTSFNFRKNNISAKQFDNISRRYPNAIEVDIYQVPEAHLLAMTSISSFRNLEDLTLGEGFLPYSFFRALTGCPSLKSLMINEPTFENTREEILISHDTLLHLTIIASTCGFHISIRCSQLKHLSLKHINVCFYSIECVYTELEILHLESPRLVKLEINGAVLPKAINCPLLTFLDATDCSDFEDDYLSATNFSCPLIESLILSSSQLEGDGSYFSPLQLQHLKFLDVSFTDLTTLQPIFESCHQLQVLNLEGCKHLSDSSLEALYRQKGEEALPALRELDISQGNLCWSAMKEVLLRCTRLTHLNLNSCKNNMLDDLDWAELCSHDSNNNNGFSSISMLQNLNCGDCGNIRKVQIPSTPSSQFLHLNSLNLSRCRSLKEVDIDSLNLCDLNLSTCRSLTILKLKCPKLTRLSLESANITEEDLYVAVSQCSSLKTLDIRNCPKIKKIERRRLRSVCPSLRIIFWRRYLPRRADYARF